ncbi:MAG: hypothetical protein ACRD18_02820 [Terriglobia bacterium]
MKVVQEMSGRLRIALLLSIAVMGFSLAGLAGSAAVGMVAGTLNASMDGQTLVPNAVVFSGDNLHVKDGTAVVALDGGSRMAFGQNTAASFVRDSNTVTLRLKQGQVLLFHPARGPQFQVQAGGISVTPSPGFKAMGAVAMLDGSVVVTTKEGTFRVQGNGHTIDVAKGKTIVIRPKVKNAPQTGVSQKLIGNNEVLEAAAVGAGGVGVILGAVGMERAGDANETAAKATAQSKAATAAANSAILAAKQAQENAFLVGCALNDLTNDLNPKSPSPFTPPKGKVCKDTDAKPIKKK